MKPSEKAVALILVVLLLGILAGTMYQNLNQNSRLTALETFADVTDANKEYLTQFGEQVRTICSNLFVSRDVYKTDLKVINDRLTGLGSQPSAGTTTASKSASTVVPNAAGSASTASTKSAAPIAGSSSSAPAVTVPQVVVPTASAQSGVPQPFVTAPPQPLGSATISAPQPSGTAAPPASAVAPSAADSSSQSPAVPTVTQEQVGVILGKFDEVNDQLERMNRTLNLLPKTEDMQRIVQQQFDNDCQQRRSLLNAPPPPIEPRPAVIPQRNLQTPKPTQIKQQQSVPLHNPNLVQSPRLHEEFVEQWGHHNLCYNKFALKDDQGKIHDIYSRPVGQPRTYRSSW